MKSNTNTGITLLLAVLMGSIALAIALGVGSIFYRELRITRGINPSQEAFYAMDVGLECVFYHIEKGNLDDPPQPTTIQCNGNPVTVQHSNVSGVDIYTFDDIDLATGRCSRIRMRAATHLINGRCRRVDVFGTNTSCGPIPAGSLAVERAFLSYNPEDPWCISLLP